MKTDIRLVAVGGAALAAALLGASGAEACTGAGVITRITGRPQDVVILRAGPDGQRAAVSRPRVLEVLCGGDQVQALNGAGVILSLDGAGQVKVSGQPYTIAMRASSPSLMGNAYRSMNDHLLPDMKRQPWDVRLRGPGPALSFALATLTDDHQSITAGKSMLLVRLAGGVGGYHVEIAPDGGAPISSAGSDTEDVVLRGLALTPGAYVLRATDKSGVEIKAHITVVPEHPELADFSGLPDAEVQAAAEAGELARTAPDKWSLEAEQVLAAAPAYGLDRSSVYELIESYAAN